MLTHSQQLDMNATALRIGRSDIGELVRNCRWLVKYRKDRPDLVRRYLYVLRRLTEAQERAVKLGEGDGNLAQPLMPLPIWNNDYRWGAVLERVCPKLARAA